MSDRPPRRRCAGGPRETHRWGARSGRGQSTTLDYTLALGVAAIVITGLVAAAGDFVTSQREQVVRTELGVVGQQLAGELVAADRLVEAGSTDRLGLNVTLPRRVAGSAYDVSVTAAGGTHWLNLSADDPDVTVAIRIETTTDVATGSVDGGTIDVVYDPGTDRLEVQS
jgi:hypothetical protein